MRQHTLQVLVAWVLITVAGWAAGGEAGGLDIRVANFPVNPSTGPVTHVTLKNRGAEPVTGRIETAFPEGWRVEPAACDFAVGGQSAHSMALTIKKAEDRAANQYPVTVRWSAGGRSGEVRQQVVCASAPFYKPAIDGNLADWADAIPVTLESGGKKTVLRTYWNTRQFCVAVEVEEASLAPYRGKDAPCDAIQFTLAAADADMSARHEFLAAGSAGWFARPRCYQLFKPGDDPGVAREPRALKPLVMKDAQVAVRRRGGVTRYEVAIPWSLMPELRADAGREFRFSLLVHDPGGTGLRDFGEVLNRWPEDRRAGAWCSWEGVAWGGKTPYDGLAAFGFCSSIH